jgi:hypothetical protein
VLNSISEVTACNIMAELDINGSGMVDSLPDSVPLFSIERVQLRFSLTDVVAMVVSNNILCLALRRGRVIRIDLDHPESVDEVDLPRKQAEIGHITDIFLDPSGSHLLITTVSGENFCLNYQAIKVKLLGRLKGLVITCVAWSPFDPSRSTGEILLGTADGCIHETLIEPSNEYFKREDRYLRLVWKNPMGDPITGLYAYQDKGSNTRQVVATSKGNIWYWQAKFSPRPSTEGVPLYPKFFEHNQPMTEEFESPKYDSFAVSPYKVHLRDSWTFAVLNGIGILHSQLYSRLGKDRKVAAASDVLKSAQLLLYDQIKPALSSNIIKSILLTEYHIVFLHGIDIFAVNRLNNQIVFHDTLEVEPNETILGMCSDGKFSTFWVFSNQNIYEIKVGDEEHEIWKTLLNSGEYEEALRLAKDAYAKDVVSTAYGDKLLEQGDYTRAAALLGSSTKPFEGVALTFTESYKFEALQIFLAARLKLFSGKTAKMQRTMICSWMVELYMERLDSLDDAIAAGTASTAKDKDNHQDLNQKRAALLKDFQSFVEKQKDDLHKETVYEMVSAHGRREELLYYASSIGDRSFVLSYWIRMEQWEEALNVLRVDNDPRLTYKYSTVLLVNSPKETVDTWMRISNLDPAKLIPAMLTYVSSFRSSNGSSVENNQAIRYLKFTINTLKNKDVAIRNTLISIYASSHGDDEAPLLAFLEDNRNSYDFDFALRMCNQFNRIQCSVYIFSAMGLYEEALKLALKKRDIDLACMVADKPSNDEALRKSLWLEIADKVIASKKDGFKSAINLLNQCELLKIEDLLPLFPDFTVIDDFKHEVISSMEAYNSKIGQLNREMEESIVTARNVKNEIGKFKKRYVLIEPGESCAICDFPLATRRFYVFPCQHAFHFDCLLDAISKTGEHSIRSRLVEIQMTSTKRELSNSVDSILSEKCILCADSQLEVLDTPLVSQADKVGMSEWSL